MCGLGLNMNETPSMTSSARVITALFICGALAFFAMRITENQADNDLWGHVLYGERAMALGVLYEKTDPFSWTVPGAPWNNHEILAERIMGWTHLHFGSSGLLALPVLAAVLCLLLAWRARVQRAPLIAFAALLLLNSNGIALGFAIRPQLFSAVALCALLALTTRTAAGNRLAPFAIPLLIAAWVNTHGGALAATVLLGAAAAMETAVVVAARLRPPLVEPLPEPSSARVVRTFWCIALASIAALCINPYGLRLPMWLLESVSYVRPEIREWQPLPLSFSQPNMWLITVPFAVTVLLTALALWRSRRTWRPWEAAALGLLALMAVRHQRHVPLFSLAALCLAPLPLAEAMRSTTGAWRQVRDFWTRPIGKTLLAVVACFLLGQAALTLVRRPWPTKVVVERNVFPVRAIEFMKLNGLQGRTLSHFDWSQQLLWELPQCTVSFDGRLDTVYPRDVIQAHWRLGEGDPAAYEFLRGQTADVALQPAGSAVWRLLEARGWTLVYRDELADVLVNRSGAFGASTETLRPPEDAPRANRLFSLFPETPSERVR